MQASLQQGPLAIVLRVAGTLIYMYRLRSSRVRQMEVDPGEAIAQAKARAAAVQAERRQAAREAAAVRREAAQSAAASMRHVGRARHELAKACS